MIWHTIDELNKETQITMKSEITQKRAIVSVECGTLRYKFAIGCMPGRGRAGLIVI